MRYGRRFSDFDNAINHYCKRKLHKQLRRPATSKTSCVISFPYSKRDITLLLIGQTRKMTPKKLAPDFIFKNECYAIVGACFEVYKDKGCGFYEPVYQECLGIEFEYCRIPAIAQLGLSLEYRGRMLTQKYFPDYVCYERIIVELKAVSE